MWKSISANNVAPDAQNLSKRVLTNMSVRESFAPCGTKIAAVWSLQNLACMPDRRRRRDHVRIAKRTSSVETAISVGFQWP